MLLLRVGRAVAVALLLGLGCSVNSIEGDPTPLTPTNCLARCQKVVTACGRTSSNCDATCTQVNEAQLSCVERAGCDETQTSYCVNLPDDSTGDDGNQAPDEDDNSPTALCRRRCLALATQCTGSSFQCTSLCSYATPSQLTCLEQTGCDPTAIGLCIEGTGSAGSGAGGTGAAGGDAGAAGASNAGSGGAAGTSAQAGMSGSSGYKEYPSCELVKCTSTKFNANACENRPCMSNDSGFGRCYPPLPAGGACPAGSKAVDATVNGLPQTLCVPDDCPAPQSYEP